MIAGSTTAIFWPLIVQFGLVAVVYVQLMLKRVDAVRAGHARSSQFRENRNEPEESLFVRNNLENQFELPTLFFPVCIALFVTGGANLYTTLLAWLFVISRVAHAWVHIRTNRIRHRRPLFAAGFLFVGLLYLALLLNLIAIALS